MLDVYVWGLAYTLATGHAEFSGRLASVKGFDIFSLVCTIVLCGRL